MHRSFAQIRYVLLGTGLACAIAACATLPPPTAELNSAQQAVVRATGADADLAHVLSREALATAQLAQRRVEVEQLQQRLQAEEGR